MYSESEDRDPHPANAMQRLVSISCLSCLNFFSVVSVRSCSVVLQFLGSLGVFYFPPH